ncbi:DUF5702 domain-containing protein [Anaerotalea alkaliphila]|uniref:Uncharacterized protein n=1 Tax=Anaerotalea alkaliphila TaxID=2662126 RepID=A0A7X5HXE7_9FIRM|nr:DUF5702 domain-containing protein [Anaerotalea alkaliphila]NDL68435.1 hypothetical protein [Anaerotalea alkaliphila]
MGNRNCQGGITVFFSILLLSLMVFATSIVDHARIQSIHNIGRRAAETASHAMLTYYDPVLFKQYGLFGVPMDQELEEAFVRSVQTMADPRGGGADGFLASSYSLESLQLQGSLVQNTFPAMEDILRYMTPRLPVLLLAPYLEQLAVIGRTNKTMVLVEEKQELEVQAGRLEEKYRELAGLVEGIRIGPSKEQVMGSLGRTYLKRLAGGNTAGRNLYSPQEIPDQDIRALLEQNLFRMDVEKAGLEKVLDRLETGLLEMQKGLEGIASLESRLQGLEDGEEVAALESRIRTRTKALEGEWKVLRKTLLEEGERIAAGLEELVDDREGTGYLAVHRRILQLLGEMEVMAGDLGKAADVLEGKVESQGQDLMEDVAGTLLKETEELRRQYGLGGTSLSRVDNLLLMKETAIGNKSVLERLRKPVAGVVDQWDRLAATLPKTVPGTREREGLEEIRRRVSNLRGTLEMDLAEGVRLMEGYGRDLWFDHGGMEFGSAEGNRTAESFRDQGERLDPMEAGGGAMEPRGEEGEETAPPKTVLPSKVRAEVSRTFGNPLLRIREFSLEGGMERVLLAKYATGMFRSKLQDAGVEDPGDPNPLVSGRTIPGYDKNLHKRMYEVEYVIAGTEGDKTGLVVVLGAIHAFRTTCNLIHLVTDPQKRLMVQTLATALAGWWSLGVGTVLLGAAITLFWAMAEAMVDLRILTKGGRVPLVKTASTWYTGIDGNWTALVEGGGEGLEKALLLGKKALGGQMEKLEGKMTEEGIRIFREKTEDIYGQGVAAMDVAVEEAWRGLENAVDARLEAWMEGKTEAFRLEEHLSPRSPFYPLGEAMTRELEVRLRNLGGTGIREVVDVKEALYAAFKEALDRQKEELVKAGEKKLEALMAEGFQRLEQQGGKVLDQAVEKWGKQMQEALGKTLKAGGVVSGGAPTSNTLLSRLVPSMSYEDYLVVMLLDPNIGNELFLLRILDLVQGNLQHFYQEEKLSLDRYGRTAKSSGVLRFQPLLLSRPFGEGGGGATYGKGALTVETEVSY